MVNSYQVALTGCEVCTTSSEARVLDVLFGQQKLKITHIFELNTKKIFIVLP